MERRRRHAARASASAGLAGLAVAALVAALVSVSTTRPREAVLGANDDPFLNLHPPANPAISADGVYGQVTEQCEPLAPPPSPPPPAAPPTAEFWPRRVPRAAGRSCGVVLEQVDPFSDFDPPVVQKGRRAVLRGVAAQSLVAEGLVPKAPAALPKEPTAKGDGDSVTVAGAPLAFGADGSIPASAVRRWHEQVEAAGGFPVPEGSFFDASNSDVWNDKSGAEDYMIYDATQGKQVPASEGVVHTSWLKPSRWVAGRRASGARAPYADDMHAEYADGQYWPYELGVGPSVEARRVRARWERRAGRPHSWKALLQVCVCVCVCMYM